jgi:hypothetical protein
MFAAIRRASSQTLDRPDRRFVLEVAQTSQHFMHDVFGRFAPGMGRQILDVVDDISDGDIVAFPGDLELPIFPAVVGVNVDVEFSHFSLKFVPNNL